MPEPGEVYWSARAQRFYQMGRRGAVARGEGTRFIEYNPRLAEYRDVRGNLVPASILEPVERHVRRFIARDVQGRPFLSTEFVDRVVSRTGLVQAEYAGNQMAVVRTVVVTADGKVHVSYVSSETGRVPNMQELEIRAGKKLKAELSEEGYKLSYDDINNATVGRTYITRKVVVVKRGM